VISFCIGLNVDAEAAFTTPLFLSAQPRIFVKYSRWKNSTNSEEWVYPVIVGTDSGYTNKATLAWTDVVTSRGNITAVTNRTATAKTDDGRITVKVPGVYLIQGMVQYKNVTAPIEGQEVCLRFNNASADKYELACKNGPVKDGGVAFSFMKMVTEEDINSVTSSKPQGETHIQITTAYDKGSSTLGNLSVTDTDARFCWCSVTHLG